MQILDSRRSPTDQRGSANGGFPGPPEGEPVRVVDRAHQACGAATRIRLPHDLSEAVVRRVVCDGCHQSFDATALHMGTPYAPLAAALGSVSEALRNAADLAVDGAEAARERGADFLELIRERWLELPLPEIPRSQLWAWASVPLALLCVIAGLALLRGDAPAAGQEGIRAASTGIADARLIESPGYALVLPAGWKKVDPPSGAVFATESKDGMADATLWIEREPNLSFKQFERRSLAQLGGVGEQARVVDRVSAPTIEGTIADLRAETPIAGGVTAPYRVTLRGAGPFRHYFATLQQPGADPQLIADIELMHNSLRPEVLLDGLGDGGTP
jgi:hypothetical protein